MFRQQFIVLRNTQSLQPINRSFAKAPGGDKGKKGGGPAKSAEPEEFNIEDLPFPELELKSITKDNIPAWCNEIYEEVFNPKPEKEMTRGEETKAKFKAERRKLIKENNLRRTMGLK